jgi:hypothetical protein
MRPDHAIFKFNILPITKFVDFIVRVAPVILALYQGKWKMKIKLLIILLIFISFNLIAKPKNFIHKDGFGPVLIGMTVDKASKVLGVKLVADSIMNDYECHYVYPDLKNVSIGFMVEENIITRIDIYKNNYSTDTGITIGQSEKMIYYKYNRRSIIEQIHPYIGKEGKYIIVNTQKGYQIIFETDHGLITSFRTGKLPSVGYIEGCL